MAGWLINRRCCFAVLTIAVGWADAVHAETYRVGDKGGCGTLSHQAAPDVAYQDGVDAKGWAVAPADLNPPPLEASDFDTVGIHLSPSIRNYVEEERYNLDAGETELMLGTIEVHRDGAATLNGKPLSAPDTLTECGDKP